ncbi:serine protease [Paludibaculum fermentans]|uniref:serine protease n=1 Tax=Paludibaculum fermentans TaxID=1473598 RepID=UPI003EB88E5C
MTIEDSKPAREPEQTSSATGTVVEVAALAPKAVRRRSIKGVSISPDVRVSLYAQGQYLASDLRKQQGLLEFPVVTYYQDPLDEDKSPEAVFNLKTLVNWEPGLLDGPTSARFAVVDYDGDTGKLEPPARWMSTDSFEGYLGADGAPLDQHKAKTFAFHQVNVWAIVQRTLAFFEDGNALGRRIPWAFEGNRLIVVPHAGYGQNAFYDRQSKSLQFYYFDDGEKTVYTCLSTDIVSHEFGHAVLDGIRPYFNESSSLETAAFHEFIGDQTAILQTLLIEKLRQEEADKTAGDFSKATTISSIAEQFGKAVEDRPYLRTANNELKMSNKAGTSDPHSLSEVLTGAMFQILRQLAEHYMKVEAEDPAQPGKRKRKPSTPRQAFWDATVRMQHLSIQPLDLLPPVEVRFRDYARAVCRSQQLADPLDPEGYYGMLLEVFRDREILTQAEVDELKAPTYLTDRLPFAIRPNIDNIARSRAAAYRFLDDNRETLLIPAHQDLLVADLYDAKKRGRQNEPLPRQIVVQYVWREEVLLEGERFGPYSGKYTTMLCGGTLVFDDNGITLAWTVKPGSVPYGGKRERSGQLKERWDKAVAEGAERRKELLDEVARQIALGRVGSIVGSEKGLLASHVPPVTAELEGESQVRFHISPHLNLSQDSDQEHEDASGGRQWQISC